MLAGDSSRLAGPLNGFQELQHVGVDLICIRGEHAVWFAGIENRLGTLNEPHRFLRGIVDRNDLVIFAVENQLGTSNFFRSSVKSVSEKALMQS
jgi:hypothetical protein